MKKSKTDRRVKYTNMLLRDALVRSLQTEHISNITVKSLCEKADVNRSTFYAHYKDPYDLLYHIEREVLDNIKRYLGKQDYHDESRPISFQVLNRILQYVQEKADIFRALLSDNSDASFQMEIMSLSQIDLFQSNKRLKKRTQEYLTVFGITGCISILQKWLQDGMVESTTEISELILNILYYGTIGLE
jgi:AcrR family transcriptional regulator